MTTLSMWSTTMKTLNLITREDYSDLKAIDPRTLSLRYSHPVVGGWCGHTQTWQWEGGDAIVVLTGQGHRSQPYVVIRVGDRVEAIPCQEIRTAMAAMGLEPSEFTTA
jgi:hypothetical protein